MGLRRSLSRSLDPPPLAPGEAQRWVLAHAYGPLAESPEAAPGVDKVARRSGLAPRLAARWRHAAIACDWFEAARRQAASHYVAYGDLVETLSELASQAGERIFLLKGFALVAGGFAKAGSREVGDLDILAETTFAVALSSLLQAQGFTPATGQRNEHHLLPLRAPGWGVLDIHDRLRGVGYRGEWMRAEAVGDHDGAAEHRPGCWIPSRSVMTAHTLAHGFDQHVMSPNAYPLLRVLGDLIDLAEGPPPWHPPSDVEKLVAHSIAGDDLRALYSLLSSLASGRLPATGSGAGRLLAHCLAHTFDPSYRQSLRRRHRRHRLKEATRRGTLVVYARRKFLDWWRRRAT